MLDKLSVLLMVSNLQVPTWVQWCPAESGHGASRLCLVINSWLVRGSLRYRPGYFDPHSCN